MKDKNVQTHRLIDTHDRRAKRACYVDAQSRAAIHDNSRRSTITHKENADDREAMFSRVGDNVRNMPCMAVTRDVRGNGMTRTACPDGKTAAGGNRARGLAGQASGKVGIRLLLLSKIQVPVRRMAGF